MNKLTSRIAVCSLIVAASPFATSVAAVASHGADDGSGDHRGGGGGNTTTRSGTCSGSTHWKIKAKPDDGRIEVEAEIDSNVSGQRWHWVLKHNGSTSADGSAQTRGASGSFSIERRTVDAAGSDAFRFRATHDGETCVARVQL